jgi:hypothetical protein
MIAENEIIESVHSYREDGLQCFPVPFGSKKAELNHKTFQEKWIPKEDLSRLFNESNIAGLGGSISGNLAILDVDDYLKFNGTLGSNKRFQELRMNTWESLSASGRPHIFLRTAKPIKGTNHIKTLGTEIRGQGLYALLPPSVFLKDGQGLLYSWARKQGKILELNESETEELRELIPFQYHEPSQSKDKPFGMSYKFFDVLCLGNFEKYGFTSSRSEGEFQALLHLLNLGWDDHKILSFLEEKANPRTRFKLRGIAHTLRELEKAKQWAYAYRSKVIQSIEGLKANLSSIDWKSIGGNSSLVDRMVFEYFLEVGKRTNKLHIGLSEREIAEACGRARITIHRSIQRLVKSGLIEKKRNSDLFNPSEYVIQENATQRTILTRNGEEKEWFSMSQNSNHDSWRTSKSKRSSLLKTGMAVYQFISENPGESNQTIHKALSQFMTRRTVERKTKHLIQLGAIVKEEKGFRVTSMTLEEISHRIDSKGQAEKQKAFHKKEREIQRKFADATPEEREQAKKEFYFSMNKNLRRISPTEFINHKTGEIFSTTGYKK